MGFTNQERINLTTKAIQAGVVDANPDTVWYEVFFPFAQITAAETVWTQLSDLKLLPANSFSQAQTNAVNNPTLIQDLTVGTRLSTVVGAVGTTYVAYSIYGDSSSEQITNWVMPQLIPLANGAPSNGYGVKLYNGDPNNGGTLVTTSEGESGSGDTRTVGWVFNYASGLLFLSTDFKGNITDPWIQGFRYIGKTAADSGSSIDDSKFVLLEADAALPNAKVLSGSADVSITESENNVEVGLTATGVAAGTYGSSTQVAAVTVDDKGRVTAASNIDIDFANASVATADTLTTPRNIAATGDISWDVDFNGSQDVTSEATLASTGVTAGTYEYASIIVDEKGRILEASSNTIPGLRVSFIKPK